jgi:hypothetical protein
MVLKKKPAQQAPRFFIGIFIIALSIYGYYMGMSMRNSPELFLMPEAVRAARFPCTSVSSDNLTACIPADIDFSRRPGAIDFFSTGKQLRGTIETIKKLPYERQWRTSLKSPFLKVFIGNIDNKDTYELMVSILQHRYNPSLMGAKAALIPPWMRNAYGARILVLREDKGLVFYTPEKSLGLLFKPGSAVVMMSIKGKVPLKTTAGIMSSIHPIVPVKPGKESTGSS